MVSLEDLTLAAQAWVVVLSVALLALSLLAYRRSGAGRMLVLGLGFGLFLVKGLVATLFLLRMVPGATAVSLPFPLFDVAILTSLYLAAFRIA
ncbi:MAG: hypothetical protein ACE5LS_05365 [Thermoplasmata archaeon]